MYDLIAFWTIFGLFMLRARLLGWESILACDEWDEEKHIGLFFLFVFISSVFAFTMTYSKLRGPKTLRGEYKDVAVSFEEFITNVPAKDVKHMEFLYDSPKCLCN